MHKPCLLTRYIFNSGHMRKYLLSFILIVLTTSTLLAQCSVNKYITAYICPNGSYDFMGRILTQPFRYYDTIPGAGGCDTAITLDLNIWMPIIPPIYSAICPGYMYNFNGKMLDSAGTYYDTLTSVLGCDSVQPLILRVADHAWVNLFDSICRVHGSYVFREDTFYSDRLYAMDTTHSGTPCDTIFAVLLRRSDNPTTTLTDSFCSGYSYSYLGHLYTQPVVDTFYFSSASPYDCDSIVILNLALKVLSTPPITRNGLNLFTSFENGLSYQWLLNDSAIPGEINYFCPLYSNGTYRVITSAANGCGDTSLPYFLINLGLSERWETGYSLFPNPTCDLLNVRMPLQEGKVSAEIHDELGQSFGELTLAPDGLIDVSRLAPGAYRIRLTGRTSAVELPFLVY